VHQRVALQQLPAGNVPVSDCPTLPLLQFCHALAFDERTKEVLSILIGQNILVTSLEEHMLLVELVELRFSKLSGSLSGLGSAVFWGLREAGN
jgi:hypothetical protein